MQVPWRERRGMHQIHAVTVDFSISPVLYHWNTTDVTGEYTDLKCHVEQGLQYKEKEKSSHVWFYPTELYLCLLWLF